MKLMSEVRFVPESISLSHRHRVLTMGSCFAENIGKELAKHKIPSQINPLGITFNPVSISKGLDRIFKRDFVLMEELQSCQELWSHFDFHSSLSHYDKNTCFEQINDVVHLTNGFISEGIDVLLITLGTAHVYRLKANGNVVNNCHKVPQEQFTKELLTVDEIVKHLTVAVDSLRNVNSSLKVIFTVSPIRHIKDGLVENNRSKSSLILACHQLAEKLTDCYYFPAYEIQMDELRDYRFYKEDLIHPTDQAVSYIWNKFKNWAFDKESQDYLEEISSYNAMKNHKLLHPNSDASKRFLVQLEEKRMQMNNKYDFLAL